MRRLWLIFAQAVTVSVAVLFVLNTLKPGWLREAPAGAVVSVVEAPARMPVPGASAPGSYAAAAQRKIASYFNLQRNLNQWKAWLASNGPILAALNVDSAWDNATATGGNIDLFNPQTTRGGHAIAVVGYLASGRFIVRNSWGTGWGDKGFGYVTPAYIAAGFFNESYGVTL